MHETGENKVKSINIDFFLKKNKKIKMEIYKSSEEEDSKSPINYIMDISSILKNMEENKNKELCISIIELGNVLINGGLIHVRELPSADVKETERGGDSKNAGSYSFCLASAGTTVKKDSSQWLRYEEIRMELAKLQFELAKTKSDLQSAKINIKVRFQELAVLTKMLKKSEDDLSITMENNEWIVRIYSFLNSTPWWWSFIPKNWKRKRQNDRLAEMKLFNAKEYLDLYPDVAETGVDPVRHYIEHGMGEGRRRPC